ncbi:MAG: hypothetical protein ACJ8EK_19345, partial [Bradyrhizobium sp.]
KIMEQHLSTRAAEGMGSCFRRNDTDVIACDKREAFAHGSGSDEAIHPQSGDAEPWIASLALAMTWDVECLG